MKRLVLGLLSFVLILGCIAMPLQKASAANGSDWEAGNIIGDDVFTDKNSMSIADIQNFLNQKVGTGGYASIPGQCDSNGNLTAEPYSSSTRTQYGANRNPANPKFTCLKDYYEVPKTDPGPGIPASNYGGVPIPAGAISAAGMIWNAAQRYNISPKVLLVTIHKESAGPLTTDDWPFQSQYTYAMGAECPDGPNGANCDSNYAGFSIQISESARLFRYYLDNMQQPWWTHKKPYQVNNILWQVVVKNGQPSNCGGSDVYITNKATAALYTYTPYQPNAAALANLYTTGDYCSAYGNRNFWVIFTDWFGRPNAPPFTASYQSQSPYPVINSGTAVSVFIKFRNSGTAFWKDDISTFPGYSPVHLAATFPINRGSAFKASNWPNGSRPTGFISAVYNSDGSLDTVPSHQHTVQPGQTGEFRFTVYADPSIPGGVYREYFQPVVEGASGYSWNMGGWAYLDIGVHKPTYSASYRTESTSPTPLSLPKGGSGSMTFDLKNIGKDAWLDDQSVTPGRLPVHFATSWPINRSSVFSSTWPNGARPTYSFSRVYDTGWNGETSCVGVSVACLASTQHTVQVNQFAEFNVPITIPANALAGTYQEHFEPIVEGAPGYSWNMGLSVWLPVTVTP